MVYFNTGAGVIPLFLFLKSVFETFFKVYLFLTVLGLRCCVGFSLVAVSGDCSSLWHVGFSFLKLPLLRSTGSRAHGAQ